MADDFDPDAYLANDTPASQAGSDSGFDPDAYLRDFDPDEYLKAKPKAEGPIASNLRAAAHGIIPAGGAAAGAGVGAALGTPLGPIGAIVGGVAGGIAGGFGGSVAQDKLQEAIPEIDDREQMAADQEKYPVSTTISGMLPFAGNLAGTRGQRAASAAMLGGLDVAQQLYNKGTVDLKTAIAAAGFGAVFPIGNKVVNAISDKAGALVPGRPGRTPNPDAAQAHADVGDQSVETAVGDSALAESPPAPTGSTVGAPPENSPTNSRGEVATGRADGSYAKETPAADNSQVTTGDIAPDVQSALGQGTPSTPAQPPEQRPLGMPAKNYQPPRPAEAPIPGFDDHPSGVGQAAAPRPSVQSDEGLVNASAMQRQAEGNVRKKIASQQLDQEPPAPSLDVDRPAAPQVVDTGIPNAGEPVAVGENEATPMPPGTTERAAKAIARSKGQAPEIKGETVAPKSPEQADAGNYKKARTHDFGKPIAIETRAGETRKGPGWEHESPYEYGYFNNTKSTDKDNIDFMRPADGSPEVGDKHFIIDQKNSDTGKYDEPKVMTYVKDRDTAVDLYNRGFGDGKGPQRMHDITEVDRPGLVKYLAKHTTKPPTKPYGKPIEKSAKDKAVFKDLVAKKPELAEQLKAAPEEAVAAAIEGKRTRKYGVGTGASAGYPVEGLLNSEGKPVTANTKAKAAERSAAHKAVQEWFTKSAPKGEETNGQLLDRIGKNAPKVEGWAPTFKPKEWMLAREAKKLLGKPTPGNIQKFRDAERLLRGGDEAVDTYRGGKRVEDDIAMNRRGGEENIAAAEAAQHAPGINTEEDRIIESIDRGRRGEGKFDIPHEEAETMVEPRPIKKASDIKKAPRREIDIGESPLAEKPIAEMSLKELTEVKPRLTKAEEFKPAEAASTGKSVKDKFSPEDMQRLVELSNKAAGRKGLSDDEIGRMNVLREFGRDTSGAGRLHIPLQQFLKRLLETTPAKSYIARTPDAKLEPHAEYTRGLSEELHVISQLDKLHRQNLLERSDKLNKDADRDTLERIYTAREADSAHVDMPNKQAGKSNIESLSAADKKVYDEHLKDVFDQNDQFYDAIYNLPNGADRLGPRVESHVARITKGDTSEYNMLKDRDDPTGPQYNGLSVSASMQNERPFSVLERKSDGKRFVVQSRPGGGFTLWDKFKAARIKDPDWKFEANSPYTVKGKNGTVDYTMREAMSREIEANARGRDGAGKPMKYYKNAGLSAYMTNAQMGSMARHLTELARISSTPEFNKLTTRSHTDAKEKGFIPTKLPNFAGIYMDPQLAHVMNDYAKPGFDTPQMLRDLNQSITKLLFWLPTAHAANVGAHWFIGRGFDNLNVKALYETGTKAIRSVMSQDADQQRYMRAGAGLIYPSVATRGFIEKVANSVGEDMIKNPSKWGPIADKIGVPLKALAHAVYDNSSKVMWAVNDMFLTQRIMELERKGMATDEAIRTAERDIPNYRLPTTVAGAGEKGRILSQIMADPTFTAFGRYHYGMFNSYANIIKDAFGKDSKPGDRIDAAGKMMAMAVLAWGIYPVFDKIAQMVTGNDKAEQNRRGPVSIPSHLAKAAQGKEDVMSAARSTLTLTPAITTALETLFNKDWRGKNIVEPGDVAAGFKGDAYRGGKAVVQEAEHAARGLVSPYGTFSTAEKKSDEPGALGVAKSAARAVRDQALDIKNPSPKSGVFQQKQSIINEKNARLRERKGGYGPGEEAFKKVFGN